MGEPEYSVASQAGSHAFLAYLRTRPRLSKSSIDVYHRLWKQVEDRAFAGTCPFPAPDNARELLVKHLHELVARGLSPVTIRNHLTVARYYFTATGFPEVTEGLKPLLRVRKKLTPTLLEHESKALIATLTKADSKAGLVFHIILLTGLRLSEFLELKYTPEDVGARRLWVKAPNGEKRPVYIGETAAALFSRLGKKRHPRGQRARLKLTAKLRQVAEAVGLEGVTPSQLRMTYAVRMLVDGKSPEFVALNLGLDKGSVNSRRRLRQAAADYLERREDYRNGR